MSQPVRQSVLGQGVPEGASAEYCATAAALDLRLLLREVEPICDERHVCEFLARAIETAGLASAPAIGDSFDAILIRLQQGVGGRTPDEARRDCDHLMHTVIAQLIAAIGEPATREAVTSVWGRITRSCGPRPSL